MSNLPLHLQRTQRNLVRFLTLVSFFNFANLQGGYAQMREWSGSGAKSSIEVIRGTLGFHSVLFHPKEIFALYGKTFRILREINSGIQVSSRNILHDSRVSIQSLSHPITLRSSGLKIRGLRERIAIHAPGSFTQKLQYIKEEAQFWDRFSRVWRCVLPQRFIEHRILQISLEPRPFLAKNFEKRRAHWPYSMIFFHSERDADPFSKNLPSIEMAKSTSAQSRGGFVL